MAAPPGNQFWKARTKHGRDKLFASPEILWDACCEYFEWVDANPLYEDKLVTFQGEATHEPIAKMRIMTLVSLCLFLDISEQTWRVYRDKQDFIEVCTKAEQVIRQQKMAGAAADLLNPMIVARDLGLKDHSASEVSGPNGGPQETKWTVEFVNAPKREE